jgi:hypothetical protein
MLLRKLMLDLPGEPAVLSVVLSMERVSGRSVLGARKCPVVHVYDRLSQGDLHVR